MKRLPLCSVFLLALSQAREIAAQAPSPRVSGVVSALIESRFKKLDADGDGKLSEEESKSIAQLIAGADIDADGFLTLPEARVHFARQAEKLVKAPASAPGDGLASLITPEIEARFKALDKNGDEKIAGDELTQARWLARLDFDKDGAVTMEEARDFFTTLFAPDAPPSTELAPPFVAEEKSPRQEPKRVKANEHGVGAMVPDAPFTDLDGKPRQLSALASGKALVIALTSTSCPIAKRYLLSLAALQRDFSGKEVTFLLVAPTSTDTPEELRGAFKEAGVSATCARDGAGTLSKTLGALSTTDVFVLDARRTLVYRGAFDDQYGLGYSLEKPRHSYVRDALEAVLTGGAPKIGATEAPGCVLDLGKAQPVALAGGHTYHNRVSRIVQTNCQECHRAGGVAPFALETYEQVTGKAGMVRRMVERGLMPPWFAALPQKGTHTPWLNDRSLPERDRADLLAWLSADKPVGEEKDAPLPRRWPAEWVIGTPDAVFQIPQPLDVKASGVMGYKNVFVETELTEPKWVRAIEVQPTAREVVHHVLIFARAPGPTTGRGDDDGVNGFFAAYVPGNNHVIYPDGFAKPLPAGTRLHFQIHYTPNGTATRDQVRLGLIFATEEPQHIVQTVGIADLRLSIPPGAEHHPETASIPVPREVRLLGLFPHMHVRGSAFRYEVLLPDGNARTLLDVPHYDFNWQLGYRFTEPPLIPAGSKLRATAWYDNSPGNPANPDPTKTVRWGPQTYDEMLIGYVEFYLPKVEEKSTAAR